MGDLYEWRMTSDPSAQTIDLEARTAWFKTVILTEEPALRRRCRRSVRNAADLDDLVAETLTRAFSTPHWARIDRGRAFLFTIARNILIDSARRTRVVAIDLLANADDLAEEDGAPSPERIVAARDELRRLQVAVDSLPPQPRTAFLLRRVEDLSLQEIAARMGLSVSTVEKHLAKALRRLVRAQAEHEDGYEQS